MGKSENGSKTFRCDYANCTKVFTTRFSLRRHYLTHLGIKEHQCQFCGKRFSLAQYLKEHIYIHTGEKPFMCRYPGCGKRFRQAGKLSIHKKLHMKQLYLRSHADVESHTQAPAVGFPCGGSLIMQFPEHCVIKEENKEEVEEGISTSTIGEQLKSIPYPEFFTSKNLPMPSSIEEDKEVCENLKRAQAAYYYKQIQMKLYLQKLIQARIMEKHQQNAQALQYHHHPQQQPQLQQQQTGPPHNQQNPLQSQIQYAQTYNPILSFN